MARWMRAKWTTARQKTSTARWGGVGQRQRRGARRRRNRYRKWRGFISYNEDAEEEVAAVARALMRTEEMKKEGCYARRVGLAIWRSLVGTTVSQIISFLIVLF
ncbi:unnamed protein product [Cuscuta campestris]|uniref:Uncharacterized protein n=1 Tax=Cuscuta campestris TaxID=132261 RepID=A0A484MJR7_9ASTE|nr:unnamed protein product [Cuscuta campestris]